MLDYVVLFIIFIPFALFFHFKLMRGLYKDFFILTLIIEICVQLLILVLSFGLFTLIFTEKVNNSDKINTAKIENVDKRMYFIKSGNTNIPKTNYYVIAKDIDSNKKIEFKVTSSDYKFYSKKVGKNIEYINLDVKSRITGNIISEEKELIE